jgi:aerobic-type carbon monoxide dehydrogenase small subunit (CoxS/CutS family)
MTTNAVTLTVNGERVTRTVPARQHLIDFLRLDLDGEIVRGCLVLAASLDGRAVQTIEGISDTGEIRDLQDAFIARNAAQCGYCTPGMLMTAADLLTSNPTATRTEIREHISGNYCRCTGYQAIVDAIETTANTRATKTST